jgi:hypothetical protein
MNSQFSQTVRFVVGLIVMYSIYQLHSAGVFVRIGSLFSGELRGSGFGGATEVLIGIIPVLVDSIAFIGSITLTFFLFMWRALKPSVTKLMVLLDKKLESYGIDLYEVGAVSSSPIKDIDPSKLVDTLEKLDARLEAVEKGESK